MIRGNVVKYSGNICVVTKVYNEDDLELLPIDCCNVTMCAGKRRVEKIDCECVNECDCYVDPDCEVCDGTGEVEKVYPGKESVEYIARTLHEYIVNSLLRGFGLKNKDW